MNPEKSALLRGAVKCENLEQTRELLSQGADPDVLVYSDCHVSAILYCLLSERNSHVRKLVRDLKEAERRRSLDLEDDVPPCQRSVLEFYRERFAADVDCGTCRQTLDYLQMRETTLKSIFQELLEYGAKPTVVEIGSESALDWVICTTHDYDYAELMIKIVLIKDFQKDIYKTINKSIKCVSGWRKSGLLSLCVANCLQEISQMKKRNVGGVTLYQLVAGSRGYCPCGLSTLKAEYESTDYKEYKHYGSYIVDKMTYRIARAGLLEGLTATQVYVAPSATRAKKVVLDEYLVSIIAKYLSNTDISNVMEAWRSTAEYARSTSTMSGPS